MKILVTGSSGLIGSALVPFLIADGHNITRLVRSKSRPDAATNTAEVHWDPEARTVGMHDLEGMDAVVHLSGENIASGRWTTSKKLKIRKSRSKGTSTLSEHLAPLRQPPKVLVCASAIGYYGDRGEEILQEDSAPGSGFLPDVCREWEATTEPAVRRGIRVVHIRTGIVLSARGGALGKMLLPFRLGLGGKVGTGRQYMSWIALDDHLRVIQEAITNDALRGAVNTVAPNPVTNLEFTKTLGKVLSRPTIFPLPAFAARLALGEMANDLLLASTRVQPARLQAAGFEFRYPHLEGALRHVLGK